MMLYDYSWFEIWRDIAHDMREILNRSSRRFRNTDHLAVAESKRGAELPNGMCCVKTQMRFHTAASGE